MEQTKVIDTFELYHHVHAVFHVGNDDIMVDVILACESEHVQSASLQV